MKERAVRGVDSRYGPGDWQLVAERMEEQGDFLWAVQRNRNVGAGLCGMRQLIATAIQDLIARVM